MNNKNESFEFEAQDRIILGHTNGPCKDVNIFSNVVPPISLNPQFNENILLFLLSSGEALKIKSQK